MTKFPTVCCANLQGCYGCADTERILHPLHWKDVQEFFQSHAPDIAVSLVHKEIQGWRTRVKLAVRGRVGQPEIGLFQPGSHDIVPIPNCPLHYAGINRAQKFLLDTLVQIRVQPYCERTHTGVLRYIQMVAERKSRRVQLTCVATKEDPFLDKCVKQLYTEGGFHAIWINFQSEKTNTIFGKRWKLCEGEPYIEEKIADIACFFHPACFMQAHISLFEEIVRAIQKRILPNKKVADLYSGVGVIGLNCLELSESVHFVEFNPFAEECFNLSLLKLPVSAKKKAHFHSAPVEKQLDIVRQAEVIIVDPPRKGLSEEVTDAILQSEAEQVIYISCNPHSFFRDCLKFLEKGWKITWAEAYLLFPGSDYVELVCVLLK